MSVEAGDRSAMAVVSPAHDQTSANHASRSGWLRYAGDDGSASKPFANFFQAFSKPFANFCVFSASFSKILFGGFGEFQGLRGQKIWRPPFSRFSKFLSPAVGGNFFRAAHRRPPRADARRGFHLSNNSNTILPHILKKQNTSCNYFVQTSATDPRAEAGALSAMGRKESR